MTYLTPETRVDRPRRYYRLNQILGQSEVTAEQAVENRRTGKGPKTPRPHIDPIIPISRAAWYLGISKGRYPRPTLLGPRTAVYSEDSINQIVEYLHKSGGES